MKYEHWCVLRVTLFVGSRDLGSMHAARRIVIVLDRGHLSSGPGIVFL